MLFGKNKLKDGDYAFVTQDYSGKIRLIIGRIVSLSNSVARIKGSYIIPIGLMEKVSAGRGERETKRSSEKSGSK